MFYSFPHQINSITVGSNDQIGGVTMFTKTIIKSVTGVLSTRLFFVLVIGALLVILSSPMALAQSVTDGFNLRTNNAIPTTGELADNMIYLPLVMKNFPFTPDAPMLNTINNEDGDGNYTVSWSSSEGAETYTLQEATDASFSNATTVYSGPNTSTAISGRDVGTYYYRVWASNAYASSGWSNVRMVEVTVMPPPGPQPGSWSGSGSRFRLKFRIYYTDSLSRFSSASGHLTAICSASGAHWTNPVDFSLMGTSISDDSFETDSSDFTTHVDGDFTSHNAVTGNWSYKSYFVGGRCYGSGTWTGSYNP
jgi:hypothetical protein